MKNTEKTQNTKETNVEEVVKQKGRPIIPNSKRQLLLKKKEILEKEGLIESGRPINIELTRNQIKELQAKVKRAELRMKRESEIDAELGLV